MQSCICAGSENKIHFTMHVLKDVYLQNATHYSNETWVVHTAGVAAAIGQKQNLSAIPQGRYRAKEMEFSTAQ